MSTQFVPPPLRVGVHASLASSAPEVAYVLRTLLTLAGFPYDLSIVDGQPSEPLDIFYGPASSETRAALRIPAEPRRYQELAALSPTALVRRDGLHWIDFGDGAVGVDRDGGELALRGDILLAAFWMLSGVSEPTLRRDRWDNLQLDGAFVGSPEILRTPIVSLYAAWLREHFRSRGHEPLLPPWARPGETTAFMFSHDIDYPEIIKAIEIARLMVARGLKGIPLAARVLAGKSNFWNFREWMAFERAHGARGAYYFIARRGSLVEYALGTPDGFYDVRSRRFRALFKTLREEGFEIGLHASYHAHRSTEQMRREKSILEEAAGTSVKGNRHHYWHLDPRAPHETLAMHEAAHFQYDSSLAFEMRPGFRRGICHPFRPYHPGERRALGVVQLPPAWMDDHFDRRRAWNGIEQPDEVARTLLDVVRDTGGVAVVNYHERGMNADFFPRYGAWLGHFLQRTRDAAFVFHRPCDVAEMFEAHERMLDVRSRERLGLRESVMVHVSR
jgi:hypothetical protein